jgi:Predicted solute binding protein
MNKCMFCFSDEVITIENAHLKREEEALVEDLAKATKEEKETPTSVPDLVESTSITTTTTTTTTITTASTTSPSTQVRLRAN